MFDSRRNFQPFIQTRDWHTLTRRRRQNNKNVVQKMYAYRQDLLGDTLSNRRHQSLCVCVYVCACLLNFFLSQHTQDIKLLTLILHIIYITLFYWFWAAHWLIRFGFSIKRKTCLYCHFEHSNGHSRQLLTLCFIWSYCDKN